MPDAERGAPIAYTVLAVGTPVAASDGRIVGSVAHVRADEATDVFDGIVIRTRHGERFVDAPEIAGLYERRVELALTAAEVTRLPPPEPAPATVTIDPDDVAGEERHGVREALRRAWDRLSGRA
jgi:hypothetical protein